jgi:DtxR family Mn-dependent transcriptional regulator
MSSAPDPLLSLLIAVLLIGLGLITFLPGRGLLSRWRRARSYDERARLEDALKHFYASEPRTPVAYPMGASLQSLAGALEISLNQAVSVANHLEAHELVRVEGVGIRLTPAGREYALRVIRAHRLWEQYLAEETGFTEAEWHGQAEEREHQLTPEKTAELARQLGYPLYDPHGDPIPDRSGDFKPRTGEPLTAMTLDRPLRIAHIEDEPEAVFAQLAAEGLSPGMVIRLVELSPQRIRFLEGETEHVLAPVVAANISVIPLEPAEEKGAVPEAESAEQMGVPLSGLRVGETGQILSISPRLRGAERRRMLDLGILPGTPIEASLISPNGDPTAYRVRETLIALRREQARLILIKPESERPA